jgi:hypothetical protein
MDPDAEPGGPKHIDPTDPDPDLDPQQLIVHYLADKGADPAVQSAGSHLFHTYPEFCPPLLYIKKIHNTNVCLFKSL